MREKYSRSEPAVSQPIPSAPSPRASSRARSGWRRRRRRRGPPPRPRAAPAALPRVHGSAPGSAPSLRTAPACSRYSPSRRCGTALHQGHRLRRIEAAVQVIDVAHLRRPGSVRRTRLGSVTAGRSFAQTSSGDSSKPTVLPIDFDILAWPSRPMMRRVGVNSAAGSGKVRPLGRESRVPPAGDLARQLEVLDLVLADGHGVGPVQQDVGRLQHRIVQQARGNALLALRFVLELGLAFELAKRCDRVENPRQLGMFRHR